MEKTYKTSEEYRKKNAKRQRDSTQEAKDNFRRVAKLKKLTERQCKVLTESFTLSEIEAGEWTDGKFFPKEIVKISRDIA